MSRLNTSLTSADARGRPEQAERLRRFEAAHPGLVIQRPDGANAGNACQ